MPHIESKALLGLEYSPADRALFLRFASGEWYAYVEVPPEVYAAFLAAPSKGRFFQDQVRDRYAYQRLDL